MMSGEINVSQVMEHFERRTAWKRRMERDAEWIALKAWWQAERQLRHARTREQEQQAMRNRSRVGQLYRTELQRARVKWVKVREARQSGSTYHLPESE